MTNQTDVLEEFKKPAKEEKKIPDENDAFMQALASGMQDLFKQQDVSQLFKQEETHPEKREFSETIQATIDKLQSSSEQVQAEVGLENEEELVNMMRDFGKMLDGEELDSALSGFLNEIMSREILYDPLKELGGKVHIFHVIDSLMLTLSVGKVA